MINGSIIKNDFPILGRSINGKPLVYLDSGASSQKPQQVLDALNRFYTEENANVHRGVHYLAERATARFEEARTKLAGFLNADSSEIIWTRNATEALNLVAHSYGRRHVSEGDEILVTVMEHHANIVPWHMLVEHCGAKILGVPLKDDFTLDMPRFRELLSSRTKIVCVTHMSNVLGTINPLSEIVEAAHAVGAVVVVDGAQAAPHIPVDVRKLDVDFYALSGHKMLGPTGVGALFGKKQLLADMDPFLGGGEMINEVRLEGSTYKDPPHRFEAGTPAIAEVVALGVAVDYLKNIGMNAVHEYVESLAQKAIQALKSIPGIRLLGPEENRGGAVSFVINGIHSHDLATILDRQGVAVRAGHHCAMPLHSHLGIAASTRASFYIYNTSDDVEALVNGLQIACEMFARASKT